MLCHERRCVFVHIPKNAGQSIEHCFLGLLKLDWKRRDQLLMRYNPRPELGPPRLAHLKAQEYVSCGYMTQRQYERYFSFAFVRNPWDRVVSFYKHLGFANIVDFKTFALDILPNRIWRQKHWFVGPQSEFILDNEGKCLVDFVGRFENLQEDFAQIAQRIDLPQRRLEHVNQSKAFQKTISNWKLLCRQAMIRPTQVGRHAWRQAFGRIETRKRPYEDYYDAKTEEFVASLYRDDVELFKYRFGSNEVADVKLTVA